MALAADQYVNPPAGGLDGIAAFEATGWGVMQLPPEEYPAELVAGILRDVAQQAEEFSRRGYDVVVVGECAGLADALADAGMSFPDQIAPRTTEELVEFLTSRPPPTAAGLLA